jgi:hypothetical protein
MGDGRKPSKPWRVHGRGGASTDYRGQRAAYEAVASVTAAGAKVTVYHWEDGRWRRYDEIEPVDSLNDLEKLILNRPAGQGPAGRRAFAWRPGPFRLTLAP